MAKFSKLQAHDLLKTILIFFFYFAYTNFASLICQILGVSYDLTVALYADCIFMLVIFFAYQDNIKKDLKNMKKNYSWKKLLKTVFIWIIVIIIFNFIFGMLTELIVPGFGKTIEASDSNTQKMADLYNISPFYTIFKGMIFSVIAEELLFRESVRDVINNKWLFIIVSALIYTTMNFIYTDLSINNLGLYILSYLLPALLTSIAYIKNHSNIVILMLIKFIYNLIPLTIVLLGL